MRIKTIRATPVNIPFVAPYRFSYGAIASLTKTIVELETEDGVVGLGECADGDRSADVLALAERLIGLDVRLISEAERRAVPGMAYTPWDNLLARRRVFGAIEMAMWDARGKTEGLPLWHLLGGKHRDFIPLTEYFAFRLPGPEHPGEATPADIARFCGQMIEEHGAQIFEGKLATVDLDTEVAMVREVRAAIGNRELRLDANGAWTVPTARKAMRRLQEFDISWLEEPVESYEEMARLRDFGGISFSSHRIDLRRAVELGAPDAIVTNLNEIGRDCEYDGVHPVLRGFQRRVPVSFRRDRRCKCCLSAGNRRGASCDRCQPDLAAMVCRRCHSGWADAAEIGRVALARGAGAWCGA